MNLLLKVLLLCAAATLVPAPAARSEPCRRACTMNEASKLRYFPGLTYEYELASELSVHVNGIESQEVGLNWFADVELSLDSPCEVAIQIKNPRILGERNDAFAEELTKWPLRAVIIEGSVGEVCVDAGDSTAAVNVKKGILSALQSSLPSHSLMSDGMEFEETDVIGVCPTTYNLKESSGSFFITKSKDHRKCSQRYGHPGESSISALPLKSAIPMRTSKSQCVQESSDGVFKKVTCHDQNEIAPIVGMSRSVNATQKLELTYKSTQPMKETKPFQKLRTTSLLYDFTNSPKNSSAVQEVGVKLNELCYIIEHGNVTLQAAQTFSDLISAMDSVMQSDVSDVWQKIKDGKYCGQVQDLEAIYLDAVAATENDGAIAVLVQNILDQKRVMQSSWRLNTISRVSGFGVNAVARLLEQEDLPSFVTLAAGTVVKTYCSTEGKQYDGSCFFDEGVTKTMQVASQKLKEFCSEAPRDRKKEKSSLVFLKAIGNMKNITNELQMSVKECFLNTDVPVRVRTQAAEVLGMGHLSEQDAEELLKFATSENESAELRIFAYKAAAFHASETSLAAFIDAIAKFNFNDQARAFILSDLVNLQFTEAPYKIAIKDKLVKFNISQNYPRNIWNTSRSFDVSKFTKTGSFGAEFLYDLIFDQTEKSPRQLRSNMTFDLFNEIINAGAWGVRFENLSALLEKALNSENGIGNTTVGNLLKMMLDTGGSKSPHGQVDFFLKVLEQEILFVSIASEEDYASDVIASLEAIVGDIYEELITEKRMHSFHAIQSRNSLVISTIQGIPLFYSADLSAVGSMNSKANFVELGSAFEYAPVLSVITNFFIGYDFGPSLGLKLNTTLHTSSDVKITAQVNLPDAVSLDIDLPSDNAEVFYFENRGFLMVKLPGGPERMLPHTGSRDPRIERKDQCVGAIAGLKICSDYDVSDWWKENDYPLVAPSIIKTIITKENPAMKGFHISLSEKLHSQGYSLMVDIPGIKDSTKFGAEVDFSMQPSEKTVKIQSEVFEQVQAIEFLYKSIDQPQNTHEIHVSHGTASSAIDKVFSGQFSRSDEGVHANFKTLGALRSLLLADVQADIGQVNSASPRLDKVEAVLEAGSYGAHARLRESRASPQQSIYSALVEITKENAKLFAIDSNSVYEAHSDERSFSCLTDVEYKQTASRVNLSLEYAPEKKHVAFEVTDVDSTTPVSFLLQDDQRHDARNLLLSVQVPEQAFDFKVRSQIAHEEVKFLVASRGEELIFIRGPFSWSWTQDSLHHKSKLGIRLGPSIRKSYHADTEIEISETRNKVQATINEGQEELVSYLHDVSGDIQSALTAVSVIELPQKIRTDFKFEKSPAYIESEAEIKLEVLSPQHAKYEVRIDTDSSSSQPEGSISAKIFWDKNRNPEQNLQFTGNYLVEDNSHFSMRGDVSRARTVYHYAVATSLEGPQTWSNFGSHFKLQVTQGSTEMLNLMSAQRFLHEPGQQVVIDSEASLIAAGDHEYHFKNQLQAERVDNGVQVKSNIECHAKSVGTFNSVFNFNSRHQPDYVLFVQGEASSSGAVEAKINYKADMESARGATDAFVELQVPGEKLKLQMMESSSPDQNTSLHLERNDKKMLELQLVRLGNDSLAAQAQLSSNLIEMSGKYSPEEKSLIVYPDPTSKEITFAAKLLNESSAAQKHLKLIIEYPLHGEQKTVAGQITANNSATENHVVIDVFPDSDREVSVSFVAVHASDDVLHVEARLLSEKEADGPRIDIDVTRSPQEKAIAFVYKPNSNSPPASLVSAKYIAQSPHSGVVSLLAETDRKKFEVSGVLVQENSLACRGRKLNTTVLSPNGMAYAFEVTACAPYFIEIITGAKDAAEEKYIMKAGVKSSTHAELSLTKNLRMPASQWWQHLTGSQYEDTEVPVTAVSAQLVAPQILALRAEFDHETLAPTKSLIAREMWSALEAASDFSGSIAHKIVDDISAHFPSASDLLKSIAEAVDHLQLSQVIQEIKQSFVNLGGIKDAIAAFLERIKSFIEKLEGLWTKILDKLDKVFTMLENLKKVIDNIINWLSPGNVNLLLDEIWEKLHLESLWRAADAWVSDWTGVSLTTLLPASVPSVINQTVSDLSEYGKILLDDSSINFACSAAKNALQKLRQLDSSHLLQSLFLVLTDGRMGIIVENSTVEVTLPLSLPAPSLWSAGKSMVLASNLHAHPGHVYPSLYFPLVPSYSNDHVSHGHLISNIVPAQSLNSTEISDHEPAKISMDPYSVINVHKFKFDLPKSKCEYVLSKMNRGDDLAVVTFKNTQSSNLTMRYLYGKKPKRNVVVMSTVSQPVLIDGEIEPSDLNVTLGNMIVIGNPVSVRVRSPGVALDWNRENLTALVTTTKKLGSFGVAWQLFPPHPTQQEVLDLIAKYKLDKNCYP